MKLLSPLFSLPVLFSALLVVPEIFLSYLLTLPPTILWRDTPEFANVAFTLSIAHPAGFPIYSLLVKPLTFIPFGSIAFRTNLASALFSLLSVVLLFATVRLLIKRVYPSAPSADIQISAAAASLLFALGPIVWHNAISAEVYTLNTLFIAGLIYLILRWLDRFDPRWLYCSAFLYGLSAGNHATVALFLPGLLALYLIKPARGNSSEWIKAIFFFLLGLSVYLYLPVRSLANPPYDWGDPQNLKNFLYQITDQKDFFVPGGVSPESGKAPLNLIFNHLGLIARQFTPVGIALILLGAVPALRREKGLSLLFLWILFSNHAFFWAWTSGDAFLPSYLALAFFLGVGTCTVLGTARRWGEVTSSRLRELVGIGFIGLIVVQVLFTYVKVDKRDYYLPSDFFRPAFMSLGASSVLVTEIQWFHIKYIQDIERLREDISLLSLNEINEPWAFQYITPERHPHLIIPPVEQVPENVPRFIAGLLAQNNQAGRPIFRELTDRLNQFVNFPVLPHQDFIFGVSMVPVEKVRREQIAAYLKQINDKLFDIGAVRQTANDNDLTVYLDAHINAVARYLDEQRYHKAAVGLIRLYLRLYGPEGTKSIQEKNIPMFYNNMGLSQLHLGETVGGLASLEQAIRYEPRNPRPYLILASWYLQKEPNRIDDILEVAQKNGLNPNIICATLYDNLLKLGRRNQIPQAQALCKNYNK